MDDSLQREYALSHVRPPAGFNPCFHGRFSATKEGMRIIGERDEQSIAYGDLLKEYGEHYG